MDVLKYFKLFRIQMSQEPTPPYFQSMSDNAHGILRTDLSCLISPCEVIRIDNVSTHRFHDEWRRPIGEHEVFRGGIQRSFLPGHGQLFPLLTEQGHGHGLEQGSFILFKKPRLLSLNLPLNGRALRLSKQKIGDRGISPIN